MSPKAVISIHSRLGCVDDPQESTLGVWLSRQTGLRLVRDIGYPTPGSFGTWAGENKVSLITLELPDESIVAIRRKFCPILERLLVLQDEDDLFGASSNPELQTDGAAPAAEFQYR